MDEPEQILALAERFIQILNRGDADGLREIYSTDARIWHNFSEELQSVEENVKTMLWVHRVLANLNYDIQRRELLPDGFMQQHILRGTLASGEAFAMPACAICKVKDGQIVALEEYLNFAHTAPLHSKVKDQQGGV